MYLNFMAKDNFQQRKTAILSKLDKSSIGEWDDKIKSLCDKINKKDDFYTTSSCSGRIIVMVDQDKKGPGLFEFVSHDLVEFDGLKKELGKINSLQSLLPQLATSHEPSSENNFLYHEIARPPQRPSINKKIKLLTNKSNIKFKSEPPILHVSCKTLEGAEDILNKAREVGWKRSGIISLGKNIIVELISTEKLEFPLIKEGKLLVDDNFLKIVLEKADSNLKKGWLKIEGLKKLI